MLFVCAAVNGKELAVHHQRLRHDKLRIEKALAKMRLLQPYGTATDLPEYNVDAILEADFPWTAAMHGDEITLLSMSNPEPEHVLRLATPAGRPRVHLCLFVLALASLPSD